MHSVNQHKWNQTISKMCKQKLNTESTSDTMERMYPNVFHIMDNGTSMLWYGENTVQCSCLMKTCFIVKQ